MKKNILIKPAGTAALAILIVFLAVSCGGARKTSSAAHKTPDLSPTELMQQIAEIPGFTTCEYTFKPDGINIPSTVTGTLRVDKGKKIWINLSALGITMARAIITPDSLCYYEKQGKTCGRISWKDLARSGNSLNYDLLEAVLTARILTGTGPRSFQVSPEAYWISSPAGRGMSVTSSVNPSPLILLRQTLYPSGVPVGLSFSYRYEQKKKRKENDLKGIAFALVNGEHEKPVIGLSVQSVKKDLPLDFPFKIPAGYKESAYDLIKMLLSL